MDDDPISYAQAIITQNYSNFVGLGILYWDFLITLDTEVRYLWRRPTTSGAFLFFTIRYFVPVSNVPIVVLSFVTLSPAGCFRHNIIHEIFLICTQVLVSVIMIQRMYALYGRDKRILWWLFVISTCLIGLVIWLVQNQDVHTVSVLPGCYVDLSFKTSHHLAATWGALLLFDILIFGLTVSNGYFTGRRYGPRAGVDMPIHTLIVRDGAMYFAVIALANAANIVTFLINGPVLPGSLTMFTTCISVTMVCRLMMNIHQKADVDAREFNLSIFQDGDIPLVDAHPLNPAVIATDNQA
ncbi:hypothetical protein B0H19DRAFT_1130011 [Mycena capillaripes]|nr:hypothetical protein B0H19DRAFT_1130011 [Mycena capillaripes]